MDISIMSSDPSDDWQHAVEAREKSENETVG